MIQKDLRGNLWECKIGTRSSGKTFQTYQQEIERLNNRIDKAIEYILELKQNAPDEILLDKLLDILKESDKQ